VFFPKGFGAGDAREINAGIEGAKLRQKILKLNLLWLSRTPVECALPKFWESWQR
jgi:hypothetical protein